MGGLRAEAFASARGRGGSVDDLHVGTRFLYHPWSWGSLYAEGRIDHKKAWQSVGGFRVEW